VAVYRSAEQARTTFHELFTAALADGDLGTRLKDRGLSLQFVQTNPDLSLFVSAEGVWLDQAPHPPTLRFELSTDTAHELWLGRTGILPAAVARRLAVKGPVVRLRQLADLLPAVGQHYARLAARALDPDARGSVPTTGKDSDQ
jgi:hypothetical protein